MTAREHATPDIREVLSTAVRHHREGRLPEAERLYRQLLSADGRNADALHMLGVLAHQSGRAEMAVELIGRAIAENGQVASFHNNLGNALEAQGRYAEAVAAYRRALALKPRYAEAHFNIGVALQAQGNLAGAAEAYRETLQLVPHHAKAHNNLANIRQWQGLLREAVASYRAAITHAPRYAEAHSNLGNVLRALGELNEAVSLQRQALVLSPDNAEAHNNLGITLLEQGNVEEGISALRRALDLKPAYTEARHNLANALKDQGESEAAAEEFRQALSFNPDDAQARLGLGIVTIPILAGDVAESANACEEFSHSLDALSAWSHAHPGMLAAAVGSNQPFYLAYRPADVTALLSRYGDLVCAVTASAAPGLQPEWRAMSPEQSARRRSSGLQSADRIRIGVLSSHVRRRHPVWEVILRGILTHIDRRRFEVFLYHPSPIRDTETEWAERSVDRFVQGPYRTDVWRELVARDSPDVMFYPEVGMDPVTCALATLRLAPVQIASWGHPVTTGLPSIDVFVSGALLEGGGAARHYREKLVCLPGTGVCTEARPLTSQPWRDSARTRDTVRFALCQQPMKFEPADDDLLVQIAQASGRCELWLLSAPRLGWATARLHERLAARFRAQGLNPEAQLRVQPWLPGEQFAQFLDDIDVYLDCPAFSGYSTAWKAIHRGTPIVTLEGEFLRQRLAAGLLRQIGQMEGVAANRQQYVDLAVRWGEESRGAGRARRREAILAAAPRTDGNRAAVSAFEDCVSGALS